MANTAMLGSLMVPEMKRRGYSGQMSMGPILGTGGLAMIIPPSALGVLLAAIAEIDVGRLLVAGFLPGFVLALLYAAMITFQLIRNPGSAPAYDVESMSLGTRLRLVTTNILPMGLVVFMVVGFIVLGWATPTEAQHAESLEYLYSPLLLERSHSAQFYLSRGDSAGWCNGVLNHHELHRF